MRILLVEDNSDHRELMRLALTGHDSTWEVEAAESGEEARRHLAEGEAYDVVFLDYSLPGRDGLEVLEEIRRGEAPPPVVMVTGRGDEQVAVKAMKGGAYDYVVKGEGYLQRLPVVAQRAVEAHQLSVERKRAEEELQANKAQLSNALEMAHLGHWEYDVANGLFTFNDQFYKIFRTTVEQVGGYTMHSAEYAHRFVHPDDMVVVGEETRKAIETTDPHFNRQIEHRMLYADGTVGYITVRFFIVKDSHGRTVKTYGVNQDITERKQAEDALQKSEEILNDTGRIARIGGWEHDLLTGQATWTQALYDIDELETGPPLGPDEHLDQYLPHDRAILAEAYQHARETGEPFDLELQVYTAKKSLIWGRVIGRPVMRDGKCVRMMGTFQDITERKLAEEELRRSEMHFSTFFQASPIAISITRMSDGTISNINPAFTHMFGYAREEVIGRTTLEINVWAHPEEDRDRMFKLLREHGRVREFETEFRKHSGETGVLLVSAEIIDLAGEQHLLSMMQDITERKRTEEALRESEESFRTLAVNANDGIFITVGEGVQAFANQRAGEITGYSVDELLKTSIQDLVHPDEVQKIIERYRKRLAGEPISPQYETIVVRKDGKSVLIELTAAKTVWHGSPADMVIIRDMTERKRAEEEKHRLEERSRKVVEDIFRFIPEGVLVFSRKMELLRQNQAFRELLSGYAKRLGFAEDELENLIVDKIKAAMGDKNIKEIRISRKHGTGEQT